MKSVSIALLSTVILSAIGLLSGCTGKVVTVENKPKERVTRTVTETVKVEKPVPVYQTVSTTTSATKTECSDGKCVAPLHDATVKSKLPEPPK